MTRSATRLALLATVSLALVACDAASSGGGSTAAGTTGAGTGGGATGGGATGGTGTSTTGVGGTATTAGDPGDPTIEELLDHAQVFGCDLGAEQVRVTFNVDGTLQLEERNGAWQDTGTWKIVGDTVELSAAGTVELVQSSEFYQGQFIEFQSPSLDCIILALPGEDLLEGTQFECGTTGFQKAFYSFAADGGAGRSTETNFSFDTWLDTEGGVYWVDLPNERIYMAFPLTDPSIDEVVETALILSETSIEILSPNGNQVGEVCNLK